MITNGAVDRAVHGWTLVASGATHTTTAITSAPKTTSVTAKAIAASIRYASNRSPKGASGWPAGLRAGGR